MIWDHMDGVFFCILAVGWAAAEAISELRRKPRKNDEPEKDGDA